MVEVGLGYNTSAAAPSHPDSCIKSTNFSVATDTGGLFSITQLVLSSQFVKITKYFCSFLIDLPGSPLQLPQNIGENLGLHFPQLLYTCPRYPTIEDRRSSLLSFTFIIPTPHSYSLVCLLADPSLGSYH